jgi:hypothetical protein
LDPKLGTLLNLAICHEKMGRFALASIEFHDARNLAVAENKPDRVDFADKRIAAIAPHLALLRIHVAPENRAKLEVALDGSPLSEAVLETDVPVDPGVHHVTAKAPGAAPFTGDVTCTAGAPCAITLPAFAATTVVEPPPSANGHGGRIAGAFLLGTGVAGLIVGGVFGGMALHQRSKAEDLCAASQCAAGQLENERGVTFAWVSNVGLGLGAALTLVGLVLVLVDPGHRSGVALSGEGLKLAF